jgi:hypothetical protein
MRDVDLVIDLILTYRIQYSLTGIKLVTWLKKLRNRVEKSKRIYVENVGRVHSLFINLSETSEEENWSGEWPFPPK